MHAKDRDFGREQVASGNRWPDQRLTFRNESGGPLYGAWVTKVMKRVLKDAGLPEKRFHDLRHTGATIMGALGADMRVLQEFLGPHRLQLHSLDVRALRPRSGTEGGGCDGTFSGRD